MTARMFRREKTRATAQGFFDGDLTLIDTDRHAHGRAYFELAKPFRYQLYSFRGLMIDIVVPRGYQTDFASIPRFFWRVLPPTGPYRRAAVIHDWLYSSRSCSRAIADAIFLDAMNALQVPMWQRLSVYAAVRCFGWMFFYRKAAKQ